MTLLSDSNAGLREEQLEVTSKTRLVLDWFQLGIRIDLWHSGTEEAWSNSRTVFGFSLQTALFLYLRRLFAARFFGPPGLATCCCGLFLFICTANLIGDTEMSRRHPPLKGIVHGGYHPVVGASIQLYAAGTNGYGSSATPLLTQVVTTGGGGSFNITGDYTCPTFSTQVYLVATGGNPGLAQGTNNLALAMMAALGSCGALGPTTQININEVTTVASVWALAPFMTSLNSVGTSSSNTQGLANAFASVNNLVTIATGTTPGASLPVGAGVPSSEINTLADILSACVDSTGNNGSNSACGQLFSVSTPVSGPAPTETIAAALGIAQNPASNVAGIYNLTPASPPFRPILNATPTDWTLMVKYVGGGLDGPWGVAIDGSGDVWVANQTGNSVTELSGTGAPLSGSSGYTGGSLNVPFAIAIDGSQNAWITSSSGNSVTELSSSGVPIPGSPYTGGGLAGPAGIAINTTGNVWVANNLGNSVTELSSTGAAVLGSPFLGGGVAGPLGIALGGSGNVWVANKLGNSVTTLSSSGVPTSGSPYIGGGLTGPSGIALDGGGSAWITNNLASSVTKLSAAGVILSDSSGYSGGGLNQPRGIAIDRLNNVWIANSAGNSVTELGSDGVALSPSSGFTGGGLNAPACVAIDGSGNIWITNFNGASVTQVVGAAAPIKTPLFGPPSAIDNMDSTAGFFNFTVVETVSPGQNVANPPGYLRPTATSNGDGTVTLAVKDSHSDTTEEIVDYRLPGGLSAPYMDLTTNRFLQLNLTTVSLGRSYNVNVLFFGAGTSPPFISEVPWLANSRSLSPTLDVQTLAPSAATQYFIRYRFFPQNQPGDVLTMDSIATSP